MLDLVIKDGLVIDGTGIERREADVGVRDGRIVAIGNVTESARETIAADGRVVSRALSMCIRTTTHRSSGTTA